MFGVNVTAFFVAAARITRAVKIIKTILTIATIAMGVKNWRTVRDMLAKGQDIMGTKIAAGGGIPIVYGTRRVGSTIVYMDTSANRSKDLYVVYAIALGELDEIMLETIEVDGNRLTDSNQFRNGGYLGTDKITSGNGSLCTGNQTGGSTNLTGGTFGTNPALSYRYVFNAHHGKAAQTADPMLRASIGSTWTTAHKLNGIAYIAGSFEYDSNGMFSGIPAITVVVKGKKVYDQRSDSTAGGSGDQRIADVNTYQYSNNPAICFQDYILNADYGKQIPAAKVNLPTFTTAANLCDTEVDQPFFNGTAKPITWSGVSGNKFISITDEDKWWQNKVGELIDLYDSNGNQVLDAAEIIAAIRDGFFDENEQYLLYIDATLGSNYSSNTGTYLNKVKRFTLNGVLDTNNSVMDNSKEMLSSMRGVFTYFNGQYELQVEDTGSATFNINDSHIIAEAGISVDYGNKDKKANKVVVEYFNAQKRYELDTQSVLHVVNGQDYTHDDGGEILEVRVEFPFCTDPYLAFNYGKAILTRSRNQTSVQFVGTPELYKTNVGDIVNLTYLGLGFDGKIFRIEALELTADGLVSVSMIEYFDIYTWEVPAQEPVETHVNIPSAYAVKKPENIAFTDTDDSATDRPFLAWTLPTDYPYYQWRVNVVDSSGNQQINRIVDVNNCDLNYLPKATGYVASITALNTLGVESLPETATFTIGDEPTGTGDLQDGAVTNLKVNDLSAVKINTGELNLGTENGMAVKQAKTGYSDNTNTGLWLGNDGGTAKLNIGSSSKYLRFDGTNLLVAGDISASTGTISTSIAIGSGNNIFKADASGIYLGNATFGSAPFRVAMSGALTATNANITGAITATSGSFAGSLSSASGTFTGALSGGTISIGSSNNIFKADSNGIYLGNATFGSAPFRVTPAGALTATGVTINGALTLTNVDGTTITYTAGNLGVGIIGGGNLGATAIFPSTMRYERSNATTAPSDSEFNTAFGRNPRNNDIVVVTRTDTNAQVAYKHNGTSFSAISNYIDGDLIVDGSITADQIAANTITGTNINVDTLAVKYFANVSSKIYDHQSTAVAVPLLKYASAIRGAGGTTIYTGSDDDFLPFTISQIRNNASYTATLSAVLGNVNGGRVQYSLDNSNWVNASGGDTNIYWNAGTYRGYTYTYQGQITNMSASQTSVYWRVYFSGSYNHTYMQLHVTMDNTT